MRQIPLRKTPNQSLRFSSDGSAWELIIKVSLNGRMVCTINRNGERLITSVRVVSGYPIIPYRYLAVHGNFGIIDTADPDREPHWERFGDTQRLIFWESDDD